MPYEHGNMRDIRLTSSLIGCLRLHMLLILVSCPFCLLSGTTEGNCTALVLTDPHGGRCQTFCSSFGHVCVAAAEEVGEGCEASDETFRGVELLIKLSGIGQRAGDVTRQSKRSAKLRSAERSWRCRSKRAATNKSLGPPTCCAPACCRRSQAFFETQLVS